MKHMKKIFALLLAVVMTLAMSVTALAETTRTTTSDQANFKIKITRDATDKAAHTYGAYQIFKGDLTETLDDNNNVTKKVLTKIAWGDNIDTDNVPTLVAGINDLLGLSGDDALDATSATIAADVAEALSKGNIVDKSATAKALAQLFGDAITGAPAGTGTISDVEGAPNFVEITGIKPGYYLVKDTTAVSDMGASTEYILQVVSDVDIKEKADVPNVIKKVKENETNTVNESGTDKDTRLGNYPITAKFNDVADYTIGEIIPFEIVGTLPANYDEYDVYKYFFIDKMDPGLTYYTDDTHKPVVEFKKKEDIADTTKAWTKIDPSNYTLSQSGQDFSVKFDVVSTTDNNGIVTYSDKGMKDVTDIKAEAYVRVTYYAKLNSDAEVGLPGNVNEVYLEFSNNPNKGGEGETGETPKDYVIVFTYELDSTKYKDAATTGNELAGAKFAVKNSAGKFIKVDNSTKEISWVDVTVPSGVNVNTDAYVTAYETAGATVFTSDSTGKITDITGLDEGTYTIVELKAPEGYNLAADTPVVITATTMNNQAWTGEKAEDALTTFTYKVGDADPVEEVVTPDDPETDESEATTITGIAKANIVDKSGSVLPSTGGIGTTIFYIIGTILVIGAGVVLITRRRMAA